MIAGRPATPPLDTRLADAAARGDVVEVILVLRGRIRPARGGRWRIRLDGGRVASFAEQWVVAATPVGSGRRRR